MVNNPQVVDLQRLPAEPFQAETGFAVDRTVLLENDVRDEIRSGFSSQAATCDGASTSDGPHGRSPPGRGRRE